MHDMEEPVEHGRAKEHAEHKGGNHGNHHAHMVADFRKRFWVALVLTAPVLALSTMIQTFLGFGQAVRFHGDLYVVFAFSSAIFF